MRTARLPTVRASMATRCQYHRGSPQVYNFEKVSSDGHQMWVAGDRAREYRITCGALVWCPGQSLIWEVRGRHVWCLENWSQGDPMPVTPGGGLGLVYCVMNNGHIGQTETRLKILPSCNFVGGWQKSNSNPAPARTAKLAKQHDLVLNLETVESEMIVREDNRLRAEPCWAVLS